MADRDLVLLETVRTHRARLVSAFLSGELAERRVINDNRRRLIGGIVAAAVFCAACVGFSFVSAQLGLQALQQRQEQGLGPATGPVFASDTFGRSLASGWGAADRGGRWQLIGPADRYSVSNGAGLMKLTEDPAPPVSRGGYLAGIEQDRSDVTATVQPTTALATGDVLVVVLQGRRISGNQDYRALVRLTGGGGTAITLIRVSLSAPVGERQQQISPTVSTPGDTEADQQPIPVSIRMQVIGTNPTTIRAKVWTGGTAEPQDWTVTGSDGTQDLQRPGSIGLFGYAPPAAAGKADLTITDLVARKAP